MTARPTWVDGRVDVLLAALHDLGMSASRAAAAELIHERVRWVSAQMGISATAARRYLTDDVLTDLARTMVVSLAEETPGADVIESARTAAVPLPVLGRCIAGLAEAIQIRLRERDDIDHLRTTVAQLAQTLSAIGQVTADHPPGPVGRTPAGGDDAAGTGQPRRPLPGGRRDPRPRGRATRGLRHNPGGPARSHLPAGRREPALLRRRAARRVIGLHVGGAPPPPCARHSGAPASVITDVGSKGEGEAVSREARSKFTLAAVSSRVPHPEGIVGADEAQWPRPGMLGPGRGGPTRSAGPPGSSASRPPRW